VFLAICKPTLVTHMLFLQLVITSGCGSTEIKCGTASSVNLFVNVDLHNSLLKVRKTPNINNYLFILGIISLFV
jgi:hypothetical protein